MNYYTNDQIGEVLDVSTAMEAVRAAYVELHDNEAAVQVRSRIALPHAKFSTMGAMLSSAGVAAVKIYTTLNGQFRFFIALLSLDDGAMRPG
jgi:ornithine cyclodeaminase